MCFVPQHSSDAVTLAEKVFPRLQHANSSVVLGTIRLIVYLVNFIPDVEKNLPSIDRRIGPAFVILLSKPAEIQYLALRNCILLLQSRPQLVNLDVNVFFLKYDDPIYVKTTKLEIIFLLASEKNIGTVLRELRECATEIDFQVVRKSVRAIGKLAIKLEPAAEACIEALMDLVSTKVSYIVQEAVVVIKNIFRKYPNRYESVISVLCENLESLEEPEAKAAIIWIIGQYADRIDNSHVLLSNFVTNFQEEPIEVQLTLLTAIIKLFILRPTKAQDLVPKVLHYATDESDNPDLRDRGYMYWRLLSSDPKAAKRIVMDSMPRINAETDRMDDERLEELELAMGTLATIYLKPIKQVFRMAKSKSLPDSPALAPRMRKVALIRRATVSGEGHGEEEKGQGAETNFKPAVSRAATAPVNATGSTSFVGTNSNGKPSVQPSWNLNRNVQTTGSTFSTIGNGHGNLSAGVSAVSQPPFDLSSLSIRPRTSTLSSSYMSSPASPLFADGTGTTPFSERPYNGFTAHSENLIDIDDESQGNSLLESNGTGSQVWHQ